MQYLILAHDRNHAHASARRLAARPAHLTLAQAMKAAGTMLCGGALPDDEGHMIGSACIVEFASRAEVDAWLAQDPYVTGDVWRTIEVIPFRQAV